MESAEAQRLINACNGALRDLVSAALLTGARYSELAALNVHDFDKQNGSLYIHNSKSGHARHVHLNEPAVALFERLTAGRDRDAPLLRRDDGLRWGRSHHMRAYKAALARTGIEKTFTFHGLRHTYASLAIRESAPLIVVAHQLGHRDTKMVEHHYGHLAQTYVADTIRKTSPRFDIQADDNVFPIERARQ